MPPSGSCLRGLVGVTRLCRGMSVYVSFSYGVLVTLMTACPCAVLMAVGRTVERRQMQVLVIKRALQQSDSVSEDYPSLFVVPKLGPIAEPSSGLRGCAST